MFRPLLDIHPAVAAALAEGRPVVALESTVIAHGLPYPENLAAARAMMDAVTQTDGVPAVVALADGRIRIGLDDATLETLARATDVAKVSRADLGPVLAGGGLGATTVAGTMLCAAQAGIRVFATGGIGGVHRDVAATMDVSADLHELARTPVAVVCSGAKSILDLPRTLELLETLGVPVIGYGTDRFPAFYLRDSGLPVRAQADGPEAAAAILDAHWRLDLGGAVVAVPIPQDAAIAVEDLDRWTDEALCEASREGIAGAAVTPYLLRRIAAHSAGKTLAANIALLSHNASVAGRIAAALTARCR